MRPDTMLAVEINPESCERLASLLKSKPIPLDKEDITFEGFSREHIGNFYLCLVAVCHQTSPRGKPGLEGKVDGIHRRGWDYLSAKLEAACHSDPELLTPLRWTKINDAEFAEIFRDPEFGERLTDIAGRVAVMRDLGQKMLSNDWQWVEELYGLSSARLATGHPNLLGLLAQFKAYRDPVKKKSYFFLSLMRNTGLWQYSDGQLLGPPVDYHEVRGHLRLGTVTVNDESLRQKLFNGVPVTPDEDIAIRQTVHDAIMLLSELSPAPTVLLGTLNYFHPICYCFSLRF